MTDHSNCGTSKTAIGKRIALARARIHAAYRTAAEHRRSNMESAATINRMRVGLAITSSVKLISCLLYEPCRSILGADPVLHRKAQKTTCRAVPRRLLLEIHRRTFEPDDGSPNAWPFLAVLLA